MACSSVFLMNRLQKDFFERGGLLSLCDFRYVPPSADRFQHPQPCPFSLLSAVAQAVRPSRGQQTGVWGDRATAVGTPPLWQALGWEGQEVLSDSPLNPVQNVAANLVSFTPRRLNRHERE